MAIANRCDICGKLYEPYNLKDSRNDHNGLMFLNIDNDQRYFKHSIIDCCPECMTDIKNYINWLHIRFLLKKPTENRLAIEEIYFVMSITNGYFDDDVKKALYEHFKYYFE